MTKQAHPTKHTLDQECREFGFRPAVLAEETDVESRTLRNWFKSKPKLIRVMIIGTYVLKAMEDNAEKIEDFIKTLKSK